ncbi:hypothetical protein KY285_005154 [Solanum tuberosum]|nr:hypothetical protein KY285_005154 [Solanum tuberosum]
MSSLSTCVNGRMFSEGFNILLQLWAIEHFYRQYDRIDLLNGIGNKINNHSRRMEGFTAPVGFASNHMLPFRVLRQFGQVQVIPLRPNKDHYKYDFGQNVPEVHNILQRWERVITIYMGARRSFCTSEYNMWILKGANGREFSKEDIMGSLMRERIYKHTPCGTLSKKSLHITRGKMAPSSWDRYLRDFKILG